MITASTGEKTAAESPKEFRIKSDSMWIPAICGIHGVSVLALCNAIPKDNPWLFLSLLLVLITPYMLMGWPASLFKVFRRRAKAV